MSGLTELNAEEARHWQASFQSSLRPLPVAVEGWTADAIMRLSECPLFAPSSPLLAKIARPLHAEGAEAVAKLKEAVGAALAPFGGNSFSVMGDTVGIEMLSSLINLDTEEAVASTLDWAAQASDLKLKTQGQYFHALLEFVKAVAKARVIMKTVLSKTKMKEKKLSQEQVDMMLNLRSRHAVYNNFMKDRRVADLFPAQGDDLTHVSDLNGLVNPEILHARIQQEMADIVGAFSTSWSSDLQHMHAELTKSCPPWEPYRENLLDCPDMIKAMCENKRYGTIGPVCQEVRAQLKYIKAIHADRRGPMIEADLASKCKSAADCGVETVAFTYSIFTLTVTLPALDNQTLINKAVEKMRADLSVSKVPLTSQMEEKIKAWTSGEMLAGNGSAPSAPAAGSAPAPAAGSALSAPAGTQPTGGSAPSAPASAQPAVEGHSAQPAGGSSPSAPAGAQPGKGGEAKRSLADRMRMVKKQRT